MNLNHLNFLIEFKYYGFWISLFLILFVFVIFIILKINEHRKKKIQCIYCDLGFSILNTRKDNLKITNRNLVYTKIFSSQSDDKFTIAYPISYCFMCGKKL